MSDSGEMKCLRCQNAMQPGGDVSLVTGSHSAASKFIFGQLAEMDEKPWRLEVMRCTSCGCVELFDRGQ